LINALVVVLAIAAIAAALLTRSEAARMRLQAGQNAGQLALYLDAGERLVPQLLREVVADGLAHPGQDWARAHSFPIDRGTVRIQITDLQGRLNVNWLLASDPYVTETFNAANLPQALVLEIADFVSPSGPRGAGYLRRVPPVWPRGGPMAVRDDLLEVDGVTPALFKRLTPYLSALPRNTRINLNTAPEAVKRAVLQPVPAEIAADIVQSTAPLQSISEIRRRASILLETEDLDALQLERMTTTSAWFRADLSAELNGHTQRRVAIFVIEPVNEDPVRRAYRWAVYD
jgi:general secretion pathway protein K